MIHTIDFHIPELDNMKKYPKELYFLGDTKLLYRKKISIVGSRKPNQYARQLTHEIASKLSNNNICIVSGGAIGTDAIAHKAAGSNNTIMVAATGLDKRYPAINKNIIQNIENDGLILSQFQEGTTSQRYNFPLRNEVVVALGDILIVMYADENSGTMRSVDYALKMKKKIYVIPHRINESTGTNKLIYENKASIIYDVEEFIQTIIPSAKKTILNDDPFKNYCRTNPTYEQAVNKFPSKVFEAELNGDIIIKNSKVYLT